MASREFFSFVRALRQSAARALGVTDERRAQTLAEMFEKPADDRALYWLELLLSMGIATFGLVLNSAGVVIGAMLVAPLMTPIVELSMALVVMSAHLLVQALARVVVSVVAVVGGAALITSVLPFHEATNEILARTSPTVLDLFVAIFCALAAAAVVARPHSGATSTAAGTAIGISLVPPLCATGFGLGSGSVAIAEGAFLLFTANFCAILVFAALFFWLVDFHPVREGSTAGRTARGFVDARKLEIARFLEARIGGRHGAYMRVLVPALLLAVVIVPLSRALAEVSNEVRARTVVARLVGEEALLADALQVESIVDRGALQFRAVVVGTDEEAAALERRIAVALASATGAAPLVHVRAVPQAGLLTRATPSTDLRQREPIELVSPREAAGKVYRDVVASLDRHWPPSATRILERRVEVAADGQVVISLALAEAALDASAQAILAQALSNDLGAGVRVQSVGLPLEARPAAARDHEAWLRSVSEPMLLARTLSSVSACVTVPDEAQLRRVPAAQRTRDVVREWSAAMPRDRVEVATGPGWSLRFAQGACSGPATADQPASTGATPQPPAS